MNKTILDESTNQQKMAKRGREDKLDWCLIHLMVVQREVGRPDPANKEPRAVAQWSQSKNVAMPVTAQLLAAKEPIPTSRLARMASARAAGWRGVVKIKDKRPWLEEGGGAVAIDELSVVGRGRK